MCVCMFYLHGCFLREPAPPSSSSSFPPTTVAAESPPSPKPSNKTSSRRARPSLHPLPLRQAAPTQALVEMAVAVRAAKSFCEESLQRPPMPLLLLLLPQVLLRIRHQQDLRRCFQWRKRQRRGCQHKRYVVGQYMCVWYGVVELVFTRICSSKVFVVDKVLLFPGIIPI